MESELRNDHPLRRAFCWGMLFGTLGMILLAFMPILPSGQRDARRAEGEQLSGSARDYARVTYAHSNEYNPLLVTEMPDQRMALPANFEGSYYATANVVSYVGPDEATVYTIPATPGRPLMRIRFHWISGQSNLEYLGPFAKRHP